MRLDSSRFRFRSGGRTPSAIAAWSALPPLARIAAAGATIRVADAAELDPFVRALIAELQAGPRPRRRQPRRRAAADALARAWSRLGAAHIADAVGAGLDLWPQIVPDVARSADPLDRRAAARLIAHAGSDRLVPLLGDLASDREARVVEGAIAAIGAIVARAAPRDGPLAFDGALASALRAYPDHRRDEVFACLVRALEPWTLARPDAAPALRAWITDAGDASHMAFRSALRRSTDPLMRARAWEWMTRREVAAAALDRVARADTPEQHDAVLQRSHLALSPSRRARLTLVPEKSRSGPGACVPRADDVPMLTLRARRGLARWAVALQRSDARARTLAAMLGDPDALARLSAAVALRSTDLADWCFDAHPAVARAAMARAEWSATGLDAHGEPNRARWLGLLARTPHEDVRRCAREQLALADPWDSGGLGLVEARRRLAADRAGFVESLRARVVGEDASARAAAVMLARRLRLAGELELELLELAGRVVEVKRGEEAGAGARAISAVVAALGELDTPSSRAVVMACVDHPVPRARANAVEAVSRGPVSARAMIELRDDAHHRVRANAIRGMIVGSGDPGGIEGLRSMLADVRPMHRLAGVWLAGRVMSWHALGGAGGRAVAMRWNELATRVAELARDEPDERVREGAARCARRALASMRARWGDRAAPVEAGELAGRAA